MKNIKFIRKNYFLILCIFLFLSVAMSAFATQYDMSRYAVLSPNSAVYYDLNVGNLYLNAYKNPTIEIGQRPAFRFDKTNMKHFLQDQTLYLPTTVNIESIVLDREANNGLNSSGNPLNQVAIFNANTLTIDGISGGSGKGNPKLFLEAKKNNNSNNISNRQLSSTRMNGLIVNNLSTHQLTINTAITKLSTNALAINGKPIPSPRFGSGSTSHSKVYGPNNMEKKEVSNSKHYKGPWYPKISFSQNGPNDCGFSFDSNYNNNKDQNFDCDNVRFNCSSQACEEKEQEFNEGKYSCLIAINYNDGIDNSITRVNQNGNMKTKRIQVKEVYDYFKNDDGTLNTNPILKAQIPLITGKRTNGDIIPIEGSGSNIATCLNDMCPTQSPDNNKICILEKTISSTTPSKMENWEGSKYSQSTMVKTYTLLLCAGKEKAEDDTLDTNFGGSPSDFFKNGDFYTTEEPSQNIWLTRKIICNAFPYVAIDNTSYLTLDND